MAYNVRVIGFRGITQIPLMLPKQYSADSVFQLVYPYEWSAVLSVSGAAVSSAAQPAPDKTAILRVEVPDGQSVRFEINPPGRGVAAGTQSPIMSGLNQFLFSPGWTISLIDAASLP